MAISQRGGGSGGSWHTLPAWKGINKSGIFFSNVAVFHRLFLLRRTGSLLHKQICETFLPTNQGPAMPHACGIGHSGAWLEGPKNLLKEKNKPIISGGKPVAHAGEEAATELVTVHLIPTRLQCEQGKVWPFETRWEGEAHTPPRAARRRRRSRWPAISRRGSSPGS